MFGPKSKVFIRLDDACPTMDFDRWEAVEEVLSDFEIVPMVAVVPRNRDRELKRAPFDSDRFSLSLKRWTALNWVFGVHGLHHLLHRTRENILITSIKSEVTGKPVDDQKKIILEALEAVREMDISPDYWVSPAHGFDMNTITALSELQLPLIVSDGFSYRGYYRYNLRWLPQQMWKIRPMPFGYWSVCLHPSDMSHLDLITLRESLEKYRDYIQPFPRADTIRWPKYGVSDEIFYRAYSVLWRFKKLRGPR